MFPLTWISELVDADGLINLLTVIPIEDIENKGIHYIRDKFEEGCYKSTLLVSCWIVGGKDWLKLTPHLK